MSRPLLQLDGVNTYYGDSHILHDVSLAVAAGQVLTILGRNGAGKTTALKSIIGVVKPRSGSVSFGGKEMTSLSPYRIARAGIGYVPETRGIFPSGSTPCSRASPSVVPAAAPTSRVASSKCSRWRARF